MATHIISIISLCLIGMLCALLIVAAVRDVRHYLISNRLCLAVAALAPFYIVAGAALDNGSLLSRSPGFYLAATLAIAAVVFLVCCLFFATGVMGGGDVKLITAVTLWTGPGWTLDFLLATAITGGLVTLAVIAKAHFMAQVSNPPSQFIKTPSFTMSDTQVPYGVAIATGAILAAVRMGSEILISL